MSTTKEEGELSDDEDSRSYQEGRNSKHSRRKRGQECNSSPRRSPMRKEHMNNERVNSRRIGTSQLKNKEFDDNSTSLWIPEKKFESRQSTRRIKELSRGHNRKHSPSPESLERKIKSERKDKTSTPSPSDNSSRTPYNARCILYGFFTFFLLA